jgi:excisionase family DNA binding protein
MEYNDSVKTPETPAEKASAPDKTAWYSIKEAAEILDVGEPTLYRWMRDGKITFRKVGDSTRFWREDLDAVMQVFHSSRDIEQAREVCPVCHHDELVEGKVQGTGLNYFRPKKAKFWTLRDAYISTQAKMCSRCGAIAWFGDTVKLTALRAGPQTKPADEPSTGGMD